MKETNSPVIRDAHRMERSRMTLVEQGAVLLLWRLAARADVRRRRAKLNAPSGLELIWLEVRLAWRELVARLRSLLARGRPIAHAVAAWVRLAFEGDSPASAPTKSEPSPNCFPAAPKWACAEKCGTDQPALGGRSVPGNGQCRNSREETTSAREKTGGSLPLDVWPTDRSITSESGPLRSPGL